MEIEKEKIIYHQQVKWNDDERRQFLRIVCVS